MDIVRNRYHILLGSMILTGIFVFILFSLQGGKAEDRTFLCVKDKVSQHAQITEEMLTTREISGPALPEEWICQKEEVIGKFAQTELFPGDFLIPEKLSDVPTSVQNQVLGLTEGAVAISVTLRSHAAGIAGVLLPGDQVHAVLGKRNEMGSLDSGEGSILYDLKVLAVSRQEVIQGEEIRAVTFEVNTAEAMRLAEAENNGVIHLLFSKRSNHAG